MRLFTFKASAMLILFCAVISCSNKTDIAITQNQIATLLDSFNVRAAHADYDGYFKYFTDDAIFIGTDAGEHWDKKAFMAWAKPYFDKRKTWDFTAVQRNIYLNKTGDLAWFDELLKTQMKICRGSGVLVKQGNEWKIQQYVLSMTIPNSFTDTVTKIKSAVDDSTLKVLTGRK